MSKFVDFTKLYDFLVRKILNDPIDFVAFIVSPFHALGVDAFVFELYRKHNRYPRGIVFVYPHPKNGIIVDESHLRCSDYANVELIYVQTPETSNKRSSLSFLQLAKEGISVIKGFLIMVMTTKKNYPKRDLFMISVKDVPIPLLKIFENREIARRYMPTFVVIEEGVGSYMSKEVWKLVSRYDRGEFAKNNDEIFVSILARVFVRSMRRFIKTFVRVENRFLFTKEKNTLVPNYPVIVSYKMVIDHYKKDIIPKFLIPIIKEPWAIIATQPFVEYNQVNAHDYVLLLDKILEILENREFNVIIKPHPRESPLKYEKLLEKHKNLVILPHSFVLEDALQLNPDIVVGFTSTVLITSKIFYNIPAISVIDLLLKFTNDPLLSISAKEFKEKFHNVIRFIESIEELGEFLNECKL